MTCLLIGLLLIWSQISLAQDTNQLMNLTLTGVPKIDNTAQKNTVNIFIDSEEAWELSIEGRDFYASNGEKIYTIPPPRLSVRRSAGEWISVDYFPQRIAQGDGPANLVLEYKFDPKWPDVSLLNEYESEIIYTISSGKIYASKCEPDLITPGNTGKIIFSTEKLKSAELKIYKDQQELCNLVGYDCNEFIIKTQYSSGEPWLTGDYPYEIFSEGALITRGIFQVGKKASTSGEIKGSLLLAGENVKSPTLELLDNKGKVFRKLVGKEALDFHIKDIPAGIYYLKAASELSSKVEVGPLQVKPGITLIRNISFEQDKTLEFDITVIPRRVMQGGKGKLIARLGNFLGENLNNLEFELELPPGFYWQKSGNSIMNTNSQKLKAKQKHLLEEDFHVVTVVTENSEFLAKAKVTATTEKGQKLVKEAMVRFEVEPGLFGEPGIIIGESKEPFYFADGTKIEPDDGFFSLQLEPGAYGLLLGAKPYVLTASGLSERIKLPKKTGNKAGMLEINAALTSQFDFGVKGFYESDRFKAAFVYPDKRNKDNLNITPYPKWGKKTTILDQTPWQMHYTNGDWQFRGGTVYVRTPEKDFNPRIALCGTELELKPKEGVRALAVGGFARESEQVEEFFADGTTGPYALKYLPKEESIKLVVESRNASGDIIKVFSWDYYVDQKFIRLKRPLANTDQLGLRNVIVVKYVTEKPIAENKFFAGGFLGYKDKDNNIYLFKHKDSEGITSNLHYQTWYLSGIVKRDSQEVVLGKKQGRTNHELKVVNSAKQLYEYKLQYSGNWTGKLNIAYDHQDNKKQTNISLNLKSKFLEVFGKEQFILKEDNPRDIGNTYSYYSASLNWPGNLVWGLSRESFSGRILDTFSSRITYKLAGFNGFVEGKWRKPQEGRPKVVVGVAHEKIPVRLKAEWEHIAPQFSLLEANFDTKKYWFDIALVNEKETLKKTLGITVLPKDSLLFLAMKDETIKTQGHLPLGALGLKFSCIGNWQAKVLVTETHVDVDLSEKSQIGARITYEATPSSNFRLQGYYRYKIDNTQLEVRLGAREAGIWFTYLIPLGSEPAIIRQPAFFSRKED